MNKDIKIAFVSLGCDKNLMDSEIMLGLIDEEGYKITQDEFDAQIIIVNSCGFILDANAEGVDNILRVAEYKLSGKCKALILTGCMAQRYKEEIFKELPEVDAIVGTGDFESIGKVIKKALDGEKQINLVTDNSKPLTEINSLKRIITTTGGFSYLKIAEGCDKRCTYCTIPSIRGSFRSRTMESLLEEAKMLVNKGIREIILIAQDSSLYGTDIYKEKKLPELLKKLSEIEDLEWIRILYCYPEHIDKELIEEMSKNPKVCKYIDMPIQHADDGILKLMNRASSRKKLEKTISDLRESMPDICIRTTLIVGFPNETEEAFNNLVNFVEKMKFDRLGVFTYSREEGTPAYDMENQIEEDVKEDRKNYLMQIQKDISSKKCLEFVGKTLKVIVEGKIEGEDNVYCGRSYRDCYEIDGFVFFEASPEQEILAGDFYNIKIKDAYDYDLIGDIVQ